MTAYLIYYWHCFENKSIIKNCYEFRLLLSQQSPDLFKLYWYSQRATFSLLFVFLPLQGLPRFLPRVQFWTQKYPGCLASHSLNPPSPIQILITKPKCSGWPQPQETRISEGGPQAWVAYKAPHGTAVCILGPAPLSRLGSAKLFSI